MSHASGVKTGWDRKDSARRCMRRLRAQRMRDGICRECGIGQVKSKTLCWRCLLKSLSRHALRKNDDWRLLASIFTGRCHYTGLPIYIGENASVDHILPVQRWPHLKKDINNLTWVSAAINRMKSDSTPREFFRACCLVLIHGLEKGTLWTDAGVGASQMRRLVLDLKKLLSKLGD